MANQLPKLKSRFENDFRELWRNERPSAREPIGYDRADEICCMKDFADQSGVDASLMRLLMRSEHSSCGL